MPGLLCLVALCLSISACRSPRPAATGDAATTPADSIQHSFPGYLRITTSTNRVRTLEVAVRRFSPASGKGPSLWLVGVIHLGDPAYYAGLQRLLDAQTVVLYEGVRAAEAGPEAGSDDATEPGAPSLQETMASSLGLSFQLSSIDYTRRHFVSSDLTLREMNALMAHAPAGRATGDPGAAGAAAETSGREEYDFLIQTLDGSSWINGLARVVLGVVQSSPKLRVLAKSLIIETAGTIGGDLESLSRLSPGMARMLEVIVQARNAKVMGDVRTRLAGLRARQSVAVFYGAAHMKDFEKRVRSELGYVAREERWLTAIQADLATAGIAPGEEAWFQRLLQWQKSALQEPAAGATPGGPAR